MQDLARVVSRALQDFINADFNLHSWVLVE